MKIDKRMSPEWKDAIRRKNHIESLAEQVKKRNAKRAKKGLGGIWTIRGGEAFFVR